MARDLKEILSELREWAVENGERSVFCVIHCEDNSSSGTITGRLINLSTSLASQYAGDSTTKRVLDLARAFSQLLGEKVEADSEDE